MKKKNLKIGMKVQVKHGGDLHDWEEDYVGCVGIVVEAPSDSDYWVTVKFGTNTDFGLVSGLRIYKGDK